MSDKIVNFVLDLIFRLIRLWVSLGLLVAVLVFVLMILAVAVAPLYLFVDFLVHLF